jgi:hypothetical protein
MMTAVERAERIEAVIADCEARGEKWTNTLMYAKVGGSTHLIRDYLRDRRARRLGVHLNGKTVSPPAPAPDPAPSPTEPPCRPGPLPEACSQLVALRAEHRRALAEEQRLTLIYGTTTQAFQALRQAYHGVAAITNDERERQRRAMQPEYERLKQAVYAAQAAVDQQRTACQTAALRVQQAVTQAQRLAKDLRQTETIFHRTLAETRECYQVALERQTQLLTELVGREDAHRIRSEHDYTPPWLTLT